MSSQWLYLCVGFSTVHREHPQCIWLACMLIQISQQDGYMANTTIGHNTVAHIFSNQWNTLVYFCLSHSPRIVCTPGNRSSSSTVQTNLKPWCYWGRNLNQNSLKQTNDISGTYIPNDLAHFHRILGCCSPNLETLGIEENLLRKHRRWISITAGFFDDISYHFHAVTVRSLIRKQIAIDAKKSKTCYIIRCLIGDNTYTKRCKTSIYANSFVLSQMKNIRRM